MSDAALDFGGDFSLDPTGDLLLVSGTLETRQRVLRRLLTSNGGYIQHTDYGAGLGQFVGQPNPARRIQSVVRQQLKLERGVAPVPAASAIVTSDTSGDFVLTVNYADLATGQTISASGAP